jgi:hypothetical protein
MSMRISGVLLCVAMAGVIGGLGSHYIATRQCNEETARLRRERDLDLIRERELRAQLEEALTARATLAQEARQLQANLSERLKRLEEIVMRSASESKTIQEQEKGSE